MVPLFACKSSAGKHLRFLPFPSRLPEAFNVKGIVNREAVEVILLLYIVFAEEGLER